MKNEEESFPSQLPTNGKSNSLFYRFPSGYGLFMFIQGIIMFVFAPIVGKVRDMTQDYIITFHCLTLAMAFCVIPWMAEMIWLKVKKN